MNEPLILDGKKVAEELYSQLPNMNGKELAIITIGDDDASKVYVRNKIKACEKVGLKGVNYRYSNEEMNYVIIFEKIKELNNNPNVVGIMVQKPYPDKYKNIEKWINPSKDVDGLTNFNMVETLSGKTSKFYPATPKGIIKLLDYYNIPIEGKNVVIIGRSDIVGKPLAAMMTARNATVTLCHSKTNSTYLKFLTRHADIIISAVGKPKYLNKDYLLSKDFDFVEGFVEGTEYPVIIDVGTNRDENGKLCGDVDFDDVLPHVSGISKSPGGVGPMTIWGLMDNCCK